MTSEIVKALTPSSSIASEVEKIMSDHPNTHLTINKSKQKLQTQMQKDGHTTDSFMFHNTTLYNQAWWTGFRKCVAKTPENYKKTIRNDKYIEISCAQSDKSWNYEAEVFIK